MKKAEIRRFPFKARSSTLTAKKWQQSSITIIDYWLIQPPDLFLSESSKQKEGKNNCFKSGNAVKIPHSRKRDALQTKVASQDPLISIESDLWKQGYEVLIEIWKY